MLKIKCDLCPDELHEPGGLFFTPPDEHGYVKKLHFCKKCSTLLLRTIKR